VIEFSPTAHTPAVDARCDLLDQARFASRLWRRDDTLWGDDPARRAVAANRLGWLDVVPKMRAEFESLRAFAAKVAAEGFTHAVLLGMGGSSLAPEVLRLVLGARSAGALELTVLDNTSPAAVRAVADSHDPRRTLFVVSSKSGGTLEVTSFEKYFHAWVAAARGEEAGRSFVAITDPGTSLEELAHARGYRRTFVNPPDIGGRYSALSFFGLVPAALIGANLDELAAGALAEAEACGPGVRAAENPGLRLGAALGELALAGRNKLTLVLPAALAPLGAWIEQLVAESTGKQGRGIVPVNEEPLGDPAAYAYDRVFVAIEPQALESDEAAKLAAIQASGRAVLRWSRGLSAEGARGGALAAALGAEFLRWEIATATAGAVMALDPFDEPNVAEAKQATQAVLERRLETSRFDQATPLARTGEIQVFAPAAISARLKTAGASGPLAVAAAALSLAQSGDYIAILAYVHRTREHHARLQNLRVAIRDEMRLATTLGYGPRFLHSTGQLHKGGPNTAVFIQFTADEGDDEPIPGERYGFATLRQAQAAGDYQVLERRGRRVVRVHLGSQIDQGIDELTAALDQRVRV